VIACACLAGSRPASMASGVRPRASEVIDRATAYVEHYLPQLQSMVGEEHTEQRIVQRPQETSAHNATSERVTRRVWRADFAVVRSADGHWLALRDIFEIDGRPLARRGGLTDRLFGPDRLDLASARRIADESAAMNLGSRVRTFNTPIAGLELLAGDRRDSVRVKAKALDAQSVWQVDVEEVRRPSLVRDVEGAPVFSRARYRVDGLSGTVLEYEMRVGRRAAVQLICTFANDPGSSVHLPSELEESFDDEQGRFVGRSVYVNWRRFGVTVRVVGPGI
jgi:hypothetical protein